MIVNVLSLIPTVDVFQASFVLFAQPDRVNIRQVCCCHGNSSAAEDNKRLHQAKWEIRDFKVIGDPQLVSSSRQIILLRQLHRLVFVLLCMKGVT